MTLKLVYLVNMLSKAYSPDAYLHIQKEHEAIGKLENYSITNEADLSIYKVSVLTVLRY